MLQRLIRQYRAAFSGVPRNVWLIALILLVSRSGTMVLPFLAIYCRQELGLEPAAIGLLLSAYGVGSVVAGLLGGKITQWIGSIPTQIISLTMATPGFLWVGFAENFTMLFLSLSYLSLGMEMMRPACATATIEFCDNASQHTKAFAVNRLAVNLGMTLGPAVGGFLALIDYQLLFYVNACSTFGALLLTWWCFGWAPTTIDEPSEEVIHQKTGKKRSPYHDKTFLCFCALTCVAACVLFQFLGAYPLYLKEQFHFQEYQIGLLFAVNTIVIVLFEMVVVSVTSKLPLLRTYAWGQLISCIGFGMLPLAAGFDFMFTAPFAVFSMLVLTTGEMLTSPLGPSYAASRATAETRGGYMGLYVTSFSIAVLVAPLGGMWLYAQHPDLVWYVSLVIGALVFLGLLYLAKWDEAPSDSELPGP